MLGPDTKTLFLRQIDGLLDGLTKRASELSVSYRNQSIVNCSFLQDMSNALDSMRKRLALRAVERKVVSVPEWGSQEALSSG